MAMMRESFQYRKVSTYSSSGWPKVKAPTCMMDSCCIAEYTETDFVACHLRSTLRAISMIFGRLASTLDDA